MRYGFFDDKAGEYVITNPDTPKPWANYLGSVEYGAIISNNAGGYSFRKSGANGRVLRYVFNDFDQPGRYVYLRDDDSKDLWSASWQPVAKPLSTFHSTCRHGLGYTVISSEYGGIRTEVTYYVPKDALYEVWSVHVKNEDTKERHLTVTGYAEFTNDGNYEQDQVNLQYTLFITRTLYEKGRIRQLINGNLDVLDEKEDIDSHRIGERFFALKDAEVSSWCGDKELFLGSCRGYAAPDGVTRGDLGDKGNYNGNSCGALSTKLTLAPGEEKDFVFLLGALTDQESGTVCQKYEASKDQVDKDLKDLKDLWEDRLSSLRVHTPSPEFDSMVNIWNAYNCFMTFLWSRAASFIYCGLRNGYGYRDTVQDIQGIIHLAPALAKERITFMLSAQVDNGGGLPLVKFTHDPGHEDTPDDASYRESTGHPAYRADDALWLFPTVYKYISETGDTAYLHKIIPYANKDEGSVYDHLKRAIHFSLTRLGPHGMPAGLYADWNDCLRLGANGESVFVAFQYYYAMTIMKDFAREEGDDPYFKKLTEEQERVGDILRTTCFIDGQFIRGFTEDGEMIGAPSDPEANLWLNPQSWAVISGLADEKEGEEALGKAEERLDTDYGAVLMDPPYHAHSFPGALAVIYNQGVKENAGIFSQSQGWFLLALAKAGKGDLAFKVFKENAPSFQNDEAEIRQIEPYSYGQFTEGPASPHFGRSHVHWLTGTASTMMVGCVEGILGLRPDPKGLGLSPAIPKEWDHLTIEKTFRGRHLSITVENPDHKETGFNDLYLNGEKQEGTYLSIDDLKDGDQIILR